MQCQLFKCPTLIWGDKGLQLTLEQPQAMWGLGTQTLRVKNPGIVL